MDTLKIVLIGVGGVGTHMLPALCRYLDSAHKGSTLTLVDGDFFEPKNQDRQNFLTMGNKAEVKAQELKDQYASISIEAKARFVTDQNVYLTIEEDSIVFCCVDNHKSRKLFSNHCQTLQNVVLISGGNETEDGNIQVYVRENGVDITPPLTYLHPEIENPTDKNPVELSCEERSAQGTPQIIFANLKVATEMLCAFWVIVNKKPILFSEIYFDIGNGKQRAILRGKQND